MRIASFSLYAMCGVLLLSCATGCSTFYRSTSSQIAINPSQGADVKILQDTWDWNEGFHYTHRGDGMAWLNLNNEESVHLIRLEQPGHFPVVHPLFPTSRNPLKSLDLGMAAGLTTVSVSASKRESPAPLFWGAAVSAVANAVGFFSGPKLVYEKAYFFPELDAVPKGNPANPPLKIEGFHMRIPEGQHSWHYFKNMEKYSANRVEFISASDESIDIEYSNLDEPLNALLQEQGFQPILEEGMFHRGEAIQLSGQLTAVEEHRVQNIVRYKIQTEWWIYNAFSLKTDTAKVTTESNWTLYNFSNPSFDRDLIAEATHRALFKALDSPAFVGKLNRIEDLEAEWTKSWESLTIDTPSEPIGKVSAAIPSVVTVSASDGHGSGCILSSDGYIVTNYHVIADGSLDYLIHFHDGSVLPATVVRYHPLYDLALLKVDTVGLAPFHVLTNGAIEVGEEAFALGTPYDIDLGASVTKGIISGKRKDGNRTLIQTDVSISPGNSGGALIDADGTLIGVVNEKVLGTGVEGIGFAIPAAVLSEALMLEFKR